MKLNLYISTSGHCSRRKAVLLIKEGRVSVNGKVVTEPWLDVAEGSSVKVSGVLLSEKARISLLFNKPKGVTTTLSDKFAEKKITEFLPRSLGRVYPVGRLDKMSRGLIILTNDGDLCYRITHPKFEIEKEYAVIFKGQLDDSIYRKIKTGVRSGEDILKVRQARIEKTGENKFKAKVIVCEGKKRHLRRLFESLGLTVLDLQRVRIGPFRLGNLKEGSYKIIDAKKELEKLGTCQKGTRPIIL